MDQASIIRDLLSWLESHLDQPLALDNVAAKAGYSKWHLQRMFKDVTGNAIGAYIRARRLSKAAVALRLTSRPILDIALQYRFDSQQTFTRAFKKQFAQTPALYRRAEDWHSSGICPPIRLGTYTLPQPEFITLPEQHLVGITQSYSCTLEQISTHRAELRLHFGNNTSAMPINYPQFCMDYITPGQIRRKMTSKKFSIRRQLNHSIFRVTYPRANRLSCREVSMCSSAMMGRLMGYKISY